MEDILAGAELLFQTGPLLWLVVGILIGFVAGAIPGVGSANAAALLLPFAIGLPVESSLILIGGLYAGCLFAAAIPAILINAPGEPGSAATALDGYPMALQGKAERAIGIARMASAAGGIIAGVVVLFVIGPLSDVALHFGAVEIFVVALFGLLVITVVIGDSVRKGVVAAALGLLIAAMSANPLTGQPRFTMGFIELYGDVPFVPAVIGIFGVAQMLNIAAQNSVAHRAATTTDGDTGVTIIARFLLAMREAGGGILETLRYPVTIVRSAMLGLLIGIIPGMGTSTANFVSYGVAKQYARKPETFGKGAPEGIIASEASDNAVASGTLIPTLALGIPGSATAAIVLAALYLQGLQPGPRLMATEAPLVYALVLAAILASILIVPIGMVLAAPLALVTRVKPQFLVPAVLLCCIVGTYSVRGSIFDVGLLLVFGILSFVMQRLGYPIVPLVLGLVLGPIAEENLLRAMQLGNNKLSYFFESGIAQALWVGLALTMAYSVYRAIRKGRKSSAAALTSQAQTSTFKDSENS
jgi:putative tricarboxylic transport membrane protein|tara:strand:- start:8799 stop:10385 length:1587 start_codon:yes stop_codon:yes gene_type:complete